MACCHQTTEPLFGCQRPGCQGGAAVLAWLAPAGRRHPAESKWLDSPRRSHAPDGTGRSIRRVDRTRRTDRSCPRSRRTTRRLVRCPMQDALSTSASHRHAIFHRSWWCPYGTPERRCQCALWPSRHGSGTGRLCGAGRPPNQLKSGRDSRRNALHAYQPRIGGSLCSGFLLRLDPTNHGPRRGRRRHTTCSLALRSRSYRVLAPRHSSQVQPDRYRARVP